MVRSALKSLLARKTRLALTALAIIAGVAFVAGTFVLTDTLRASFDDLFGVLNEGQDAVVRAEAEFTNNQSYTPGRELVPEEVLADVQALPEVGEALGSVFGYAQIIDPDGEAITTGGAPTLGFGWTESELLNITDLRTGRGPEADNEVAIDAGTAEDNGFVVGDPISIITQQGVSEYVLVGTFGFDEVDNLLGSTNVGFTMEVAQRVMDVEGGFNEINVAAAEGVGRADLIVALEAALPAGYEAVDIDTVTEEQTDQINEGFLDIFNIALLVFAGISMFVGAFIIANTYSIIVAQRTKEMALFRALGATGGQVIWLVMLEALIIGVVASAIGVAAGALIATLLKGAFSAIGADLPAAGLVFQPRTIIAGMAVGVTVTMLASLAPAITASNVPPVAAMRDVEHGPEKFSLRRLITGGGITALGLVLLLGGLFGNAPQPLAFVGAGALVIFLGIAFLSPLIAGRMARIIGFPARRMFGMTGKLARENAGRRPVRTAATAGALMIGIALVSFFLIFGESLKVSALAVIDDAIATDVVATTGAGGPPQPISPQLATDLEALPEVELATGVKGGEVRFEGSRNEIGGVDQDKILAVTNVEFTSGGIERLSENGTVIVIDEKAEEEGWVVGDTVPLEFARTGIQQLEIIGIYSAEELIIGTWNVGISTFEANFTETPDGIVFANFTEGVSATDADTALAEVAAAYPNVEFQSQAEFKEDTETALNQLLSIILLMLVLALLIALLGITNTLALSVFERTREIGLLRAVGMTRRQTRAMVRYEAFIVALFGAALGVAIGLFFGWVVVQAASDFGIDQFAVPGGQIVVVFIVAGLAGILAAVSPARRAAKLNVLEAIAYE